MSLLEKASIITTPTAYGVGVLNSIKPAYALGEELVTNGNFSNGTTSWTPNTNATLSIEDGRLKVAISGAGSGYPSQNITTEVGKKYIITANAYIGTATKVSLYSPVIGFNDLTADGSYNLTFTATSTSTQIRLYVYGDGSFGFWDNVSVKKVTDADFDFTRTSSATRVNSDNLIETVSINSDNLVQNGNFSELGSELVPSIATIQNLGGGSITQISDNSYSSTSDGTSGSTLRPRLLLGTTSGKTYKLVITPIGAITGTVNFDFYDGSSYLFSDYDFSTVKEIYFTDNGNVFGAFDGTETYNINSFTISVKQVDPNDYWVVGTGWSYGTNKITHSSGTGSASRLKQLGFNNTSVYKLTITITNKGANTYRIFNGAGSAVSLLEGTNTYSVSGLLAGQLIIEPISHPGGDVEFSNISVIEIQENGVPRLDYTNGTASILLENQSTNLLNYSNDYSNSAWIKSNTTVASGYLGLDGTNSAWLITKTASSFAQIKQSITFSGIHTFSVYLKKGTITSAVIRSIAGTDAKVEINLIDGTTSGEVNTISSKTESMGNDWWRCSLTFNASNNNTVLIYPEAPLNGSNAGNIYMQYAQLENESFSTSYIPTSGSAVTRAAETLNNAANSDLINSTEGVLYAEVATLVEGGSNRFLGLSDGSSNNRVVILYTNAANKIRAILSSGGTKYVDKTVDVSSTTEFNKVAIKYKANDFALWINGVEVATDTSLSAPVGLDRFDFLLAGANNFYGKVKSIAVFKEALSDTELTCLTSTSNREIFLNYYYRMQYVGANTEALSCAEQTFNI